MPTGSDTVVAVGAPPGRRENFLGPPGEAPRRGHAPPPRSAAGLGGPRPPARVAERQRQIRGLRAHPPRQQPQELGVLVVGMRADHQHALVAAELPQRTRQRSDAAGAGRGQLSLRDTGGAEAQGEPEEPDDKQFHYWERYTAPPFITNLTRCSSVISRVGSPATAMMSAYTPGAMAPKFCSWPRSAAATVVPD